MSVECPRGAASAKINYEGFKDVEGYVYEPVRTIVCDIPELFVEKSRDLAEYDPLGERDDPLWMN